LKEKSGKDYIKLSDKINCCETDLKKLQNILIENIEEIWDVNFIVFFKYLIKEETFQEMMRY